MVLGIPGLIVIGAALRGYLWYRSKAGPASTLGGRIHQGVDKVLSSVSWAAFAAAILLLLLPTFKGGDLSGDTLAQLNDLIGRYNGWLKYSWLALLALCLFLVASAWLVRTEASAASAQMAGRVAKGTGVIKAVVGLLAACSFVGGDLSGRLLERKSDAQAAKAELETVRLALFAKARSIVVTEAVVEAIREADEAPEVRRIHLAYARTARYLEIPVVEAIGARPIPAEVRAADLPDMPLRKAQALAASLDKAPPVSGQDALVEQIVKATLDKSLVGPLKKHLVAIDNPVLSAIADAFIDPVLVDPLMKRAGAEANRFLRGGGTLDEARANARQAGRAHSGVVRAKAAGVRAPAPSNVFGEPAWDGIRDNLSRILQRGLPDKSREVVRDMRAMGAEFDNLRSALNQLLANAPQRQAMGEKAFVNFLRTRPDYSAVWGYAVIGMPPPQHVDELRRISIAGHPDRIEAIRGVLELAEAGDSEGIALKAKYGLADLKSSMSDEAIARFWYDTAHGPYPVDGYALYFKASGLGDPVAETALYNGDAIGKYVGLYCPAG